MEQRWCDAAPTENVGMSDEHAGRNQRCLRMMLKGDNVRAYDLDVYESIALQGTFKDVVDGETGPVARGGCGCGR